MSQKSSAQCIFCKIVANEIPATKLADNQHCLAINDLQPQAPHHILIIPKAHIANITECTDINLMGNLFAQANQLAQEMHFKNGFRLVVNTGTEGGQTVDHFHIHLLAGRSMQWPPG